MTEKGIKPLVSICIANYNGEAYIEEAIESVLSQEFDQTTEIIVHDDASTDDSVNVIKSKFPAVRVIESADNVGFCISNNRMAEQAKGEFLLLLNNDAKLRDGSLASFTAASKAIGVPAILGQPQYSISDGALVDRGYEFDIFVNPVPLTQRGTHQVATVTAGCMWIPRVIWDSTGGFPEWFESVAEDIFLCQSARLLGYPTYILDGPGFDHWVGRNLGGGKLIKSKLASTVRRRKLSERNKTSIMLTCYPLWTLLLLIPVHITLLACEAVVLSMSKVGPKKTWGIYAKLLPDLWKQRGEILDLRRKLIKKRNISSWSFMKRFQLTPHKLTLLVRHGFPRLS